jgi:hypothetical protein
LSLYRSPDFVDGSMKKGTIIDRAELQPLSKATRLRLDGGKIKITHGPFVEAKEVVGGYALSEAARSRTWVKRRRGDSASDEIRAPYLVA